MKILHHNYWAIYSAGILYTGKVYTNYFSKTTEVVDIPYYRVI